MNTAGLPPRKRSSLRFTMVFWTGLGLLLLAAALIGFATMTLHAKEMDLMQNKALA